MNEKCENKNEFFLKVKQFYRFKKILLIITMNSKIKCYFFIMIS